MNGFTEDDGGRHLVRPRLMWSGVVVALAGAGLLAWWTATWHPLAGAVGGVLLVIGGVIATFGGVFYDTHDRRPIDGEVEDLRDAHVHRGTAPGDMLTDPRLRADAALTSRRTGAVRRAAQRAPRAALQPLGSWLLLGGAAALVVTQSWYPHTDAGQSNATRALLIAIVVALAGLRTLLAQRPGRLPSVVAGVAGLLLVALALFTHHDRHAIVSFTAIVGCWIVIASLLTLDRPRVSARAVPGSEREVVDESPAPPARRAQGRRGAGTGWRTRLILVLGPASVALVGVARGRVASTPAPRKPQKQARQAHAVPAAVDAAAAVAITALGMRLLGRRRKRGRRPAPRPSRSLQYRVPVGQDPAAVIATLRQAGYRVERDVRPTHIQDLLITSATGSMLDGGRVRAVIERAPIDLGGGPAPAHTVEFVDEPDA